MQIGTNLGAQPPVMAHQVMQLALKANITASLIGLVLLAYLDRSDLGAHAIALLAVVLLGFAAVSFLLLRSVATIPYPALILLGLVMVVTGLVIPVQTKYGAAFSAGILTLGIMVLFSVFMQRLMRSSHKTRMVVAWDTMITGLVFAPVVNVVSTVFFLLLGFPMTIALPAACLTVLAVNPLAALAIIVHGNPLERGIQAIKS